MAYSDRFAETTPQDEIFTQIGLAAAVGTAAPAGIKYGIDPVTGERLYVDNSGDWQLVPSAATPLEVVEVTTNAAPYDMVAYTGTAENVIVLNKSGGTLQVEGFATAPQFIEDGEQIELTKDSVGAWYQQEGGGGLETVRVDANAAAQNLTLPAATGSEDAILYTLVDKTNAANVTVQAGEQLNGVVDATFNFDNYATGTQFLATDRGTGLWDISVVGASTQSDLDYAFISEGRLNNNIQGSIQQFDNLQDDSSIPPDSYRLDLSTPHDLDLNGVTAGANEVTINKTGRYTLNFTAIIEYNANSNLPVQMLVRNGTEVLGVASGREAGGNTEYPHTLPITFEGTLNAGDTLDVRYAAHGITTGDVILNNYTFVVRELPSTESVLAGAVVPEDLHYYNFSATNTLFTNGGVGMSLNPSAFAVSYDPKGLRLGNTIVISQAGTYKIDISAGISVGEDTAVRVNGVEVAALDNDDTNDHSGTSATYIGVLSIGDVIDFVPTVNTNYYSPSVSVIQLPTSTVVDPGSITPTDIGEHKFTATADNAAGFPGSIQNITFDSYTDTVNSGSIATFDGTNIVVTAGVNDIELKALIHTDGTGGHNAITYFRDSADAIGLKFGDGAVTNGVSSRGVYGEGSDNYPATALVRAGTTVTLNLVHNASAASQLMQTGSYIHVKEIVAQQTVVDTNTAPLLDEDDMLSDSDTSVPTQQSVKAYVDANAGGSTSIQSGTTPDPGGVGADLRTVTFPTAFTTVPAVTANAVDIPELTGGMTVNIVSKSITNFTYVIKRIPDNAPHGKWHAISWIAVE